MSACLAKSMCRSNPTRALVELEEESLEMTDASISKGPFGVFQLPVNTDTGTVSNNQSSDGNESPLAPVMEALDSLEQTDGELCLDRDVFASQLSIDPVMSNQDVDYSLDYSRLDDPWLFPTLSLPMDTSPDSWELLSHYRDRVVPLLSPLNVHGKSPWHHLILPAAMNVLAEMAMGSTVSAARSALLNAVLATSALHRHRRSSAGEHWEMKAAYYQKQAQQDLLYCFQKEVGCTPKRVKYKDVLMTVLTLATYSVRLSGPSQKECKN